MFDSLNKRLGSVFGKLRKKGALTEADIDEAMREIRVALLEADVALPVVRAFVAELKEKALGQSIVRSVSPAQMVIKLVHDHLKALLGSENQALNLATRPPAILLMVGLQGSGKTTSSGKLALYLKDKQHKKVMVASLDIYRPAAQEQLAVVAQQVGVDALPIIAGQKPREIVARAIDQAERGSYDILILDTAGRLHIDDALMQELQDIKKQANPIETLLVADAMTGQDAVQIAEQFHQKIGVSGIILTRVDGDARGGAALSMRQVTQQPIKFMGVGEKLTQLEPFHPERIAGRILDMGDVVSLVERAAETIDQQEAEDLAVRMQKGQFDLNDLLKQMRNMKKMGGIGSMLGMIPGMGKIKEQIQNVKMDDKLIARQEAIILSMTPQERSFPKLIKGSRRARIAKGAGVEVQDVNRLLKNFQQMEGMMKKMSKMGKKGMTPAALKQMLPGKF